MSFASASDVNNIDDNLTATIDEKDVISVDDIENNEIMMLSEDDAIGASNSDDVLGTGTRSDFNSLMNTMRSGSTVYLNDDYDFAGSYSSSSYNINYNNVVIDGQGHYIDASGLGRVFNIYGNNITFKNIVFKNALFF